MLKKLIPAILILLMPALVCAWPAGWNSVGIVTIGAEGDPNLKGHGSFVVTDNGIFSAKHLVENLIPKNFRVVKKYKEIDLIKIKLLGRSHKRKDFTISPIAKYIDPDKPVYFIGYIDDTQKVIRYGHIMGRVDKDFYKELKDHIMVDVSALPGMSGGGVFQDGKVIGVCSLSFVYRERGSLFSVFVPLPGVKWKN